MRASKISALCLVLGLPCLKAMTVRQTDLFDYSGDTPTDNDNHYEIEDVFDDMTSRISIRPTSTITNTYEDDSYLSSIALEFMAQATQTDEPLEEPLDQTESTLPTPEPAVPTQARVYICNQANWEGDCLYRVEPLGSCIELFEPWDQSIMSFGPDGSQRCTIFDTQACDGMNATTTLEYPGSAELSTLDDSWENRIRSWSCIENLVPEDGKREK